MARKYRKVEQLVEIIEQRSKAGETYREIGASLGLSRDEVRGAMHRYHAKERKPSKPPEFSGLRVRDWLKSQSFEAQTEFGWKIIRQYRGY